MAPWARVKKRLELEEVVANFDVYPLGKVLWSMVSGRSDLPFWWWKRDEHNLERLFPDEPRISFVHDILRVSVVDDEAACLHSAEKLLEMVDRLLLAVRGGGQPIGEGVSRRCLVCGRGQYVSLYDGEKRRLALTPATGLQGAPSVAHVFSDNMLALTLRTFRCNLCGHVQFFHFPDGLTPALWNS